MAKIALLIGTGEYTEELKPLPAAPRDVEAIAAILSDPEMGGFNQVDTLINQSYTTIAERIETWFRERQKDDLALLYISGHGIKDAHSDLYFAACDTRKQREELVLATAVSASFVRDRMRDSKARRQVIILDCCFSGAFGDLLPRDDGTINLETLLGAEGRVVLTSSSSIQYAFEQREGTLSIYTRYLVEGIRTGAADNNGDGIISVQELHDYAKLRVQEESPAMTPRIIVLRDEGFQIQIARAPLGDPKVIFRREVEARARQTQGKLSPIALQALEILRQQLGLSREEAELIITEVLRPYRIFEGKLAEFEQAVKAVKETPNQDPQMIAVNLDDLRFLQRVLELRDEDVASILSGYPPPPPPGVWKRIFLGSAMVAALLGGIGLWIYLKVDIAPPNPMISAGDNPNLYGSRSSSADFRNSVVKNNRVNYQEKQLNGIKKFKAEEYRDSLDVFTQILAIQKGNDFSDPRKDPEIQIFQNNSQARLNYQQNGSQIYTIAAAVPLSDVDGKPFDIGQQILLGIAQAQAKAIDEQGINLEVVIANARNSPEQVEELAQDLSKQSITGFDQQQREILAVIGHYSSTVTCTALPSYNEAGLAVISPASTRTDMRSSCTGDKVFFRTGSSSVIEAQALVDYLVKKSRISKPKIAVFYKNNEGFSKDLSEAFNKALKDAPGYSYQISQFDLSTPSDVDKGKSQINNHNFDVLAVFPDGRTLNGNEFKAAIDIIELDAGRSLILGSNPLDNWQVTQDKQDKMNTLKVQPNSPGKGLVLAIDWLSGCDSNAAFDQTARTFWGGSPTRMYAQAYEAVQVLVDSLNRGKTTGSDILKDLEDLGNPKHEVKSYVFRDEKISFDQNGDRNEIKNRILITPYQNGDQQFGPVSRETSCPSAQ